MLNTSKFIKRSLFLITTKREYWKGFEIVEWDYGDKELRVCYWTRKRKTEIWRWGQFNTIISLDKLKSLVKMVEEVL